jgi:hypothetical protein
MGFYCWFSATCDGALGYLLSCGFSLIWFVCTFPLCIVLVSLVSGVSSFTLCLVSMRETGYQPALKKLILAVPLYLLAIFTYRFSFVRGIEQKGRRCNGRRHISWGFCLLLYWWWWVAAVSLCVVHRVWWISSTVCSMTLLCLRGWYRLSTVDHSSLNLDIWISPHWGRWMLSRASHAGYNARVIFSHGAREKYITDSSNATV